MCSTQPVFGVCRAPMYSTQPVFGVVEHIGVLHTTKTG